MTPIVFKEVYIYQSLTLDEAHQEKKKPSYKGSIDLSTSVFKN